MSVPADTLREFAGTAPCRRASGRRRRSISRRLPGAAAETGYKGRLGIYEMLVMSEAMERLTAPAAPSWRSAARRASEGMRTMREDGVMKVLAGHTSIEEVHRAIG